MFLIILFGPTALELDPGAGALESYVHKGGVHVVAAYCNRTLGNIEDRSSSEGYGALRFTAKHLGLSLQVVQRHGAIRVPEPVYITLESGEVIYFR